MPLDESYSFDYNMNAGEAIVSATDAAKGATDATKLATKLGLSQDEKEILSVIQENSRITQKELHETTGISLGTIKRILPRLQKKGILVRIGSRRSGQWKVQNSTMR